MAENESIGGISVEIVGDYSRLKSDIDGAVQVAAAAGAEIAEALNAGAAGADALSGAVSAAALGLGTFEEQIAALVSSGSTLAEALAAVGTGAEAISASVETAGTAAQAAASQLELFDAAVAVPYADAAGQLNLFSTELEPIGAAATSAAGGVEKLGEAAGSAAGGEEKFSEAAQDIIDKQAKLEQSVTTAAGALQEIFSAYQKGEVNAATLAAAQENLAAAVAKTGQAASDAVPPLDGLGTALLKIAGISLSIAALKSFAEEAIEVYGAAERAAEGIAFLRGNIADAGAVLKDLRETAQGISEPFESVAAAAQKMAFFGMTAEQTAAALTVASDAAKVSGKSFEGMADAINNIVLTGMVMPRTLKNIGVTSQELADVLGVTTKELKNVFKEMDPAGREMAIIAAMDKVRGATDEMANDTKSAVTRMKNDWTFAMEDMGSAIAPLAVEAIPNLTAAFKYLVTGALQVVTAIKQITDVVVGITTVALQAVVGYSKVWGDLLTNDFAGAAIAAKDAFANIKTASTFTWDSLIKDGKDGEAALSKVWASQAATHHTMTQQEMDDAAKAAAAEAQRVLASQQSAAELKKEQKEVEAFGKAIGMALDLSSKSYEDYLATLTEGGKKAASILAALTQDIAKGELEASKMSGAPLAAMDALLDKLRAAQAVMKDFAAQDAWNATAEKVSVLANKYSAELGKMDAATLDWVNSALAAARDIPDALSKIKPEELLKTWLEQQEKLDEQTKKLGISFQKALDQWDSRVRDQVIPITATLTQRLAGVDVTLQGIAANAANAFPVSQVSQYLDLVHEMNKAGYQTVQNIDSQVASNQALLDKMKAFGQPLTEQLDLQAKIYAEEVKKAELEGKSADYFMSALIATKGHLAAIQVATHNVTNELYEQIKADQGIYDAMVKNNSPLVQQLAQLRTIYDEKLKYKELTNESATSEILAIEAVTLAQKAQWDQVHLEGEVIKGAINDTIEAIEHMGSSMAKVIVEGGNMAKVFVDTAKQIAEAIITRIINGALTLLVDSIITSVIPTWGGISGAVAGTTAAIHTMQVSMAAATASMTANLQALTAQFAALSAAISGPSGAGGAAGAAGAAKGAGTMGTVGAIADVVSAVSNIISNVQFMHMNDSLKVIVQHTLAAANDLANMREDLWSQFNQMYDRVGEIWRDMREGFQSLADGIGTGTAQAAGDAAATQTIFSHGLHDLTQVVRAGQQPGVRGGAGSSTQTSDTPWNPYPAGVTHDIWDSLVRPNPNAPSLPSVPSSPRMVNPSSAAASAGASTSIGAVTFNVYEAQNPRATVRSISDSLKILSPQFAAFSS